MFRRAVLLIEKSVKYTIFQLWICLLATTFFLGHFAYSLYAWVRFIVNWIRFGKLKKRVVVIGGGFAGSTVAKTLQRLMEVHLIDTKEFFEFTPSVLRVIVSPNQVKSIQVMHENYLPHATVHHATVTEIKPEQNLVVFKHHPEESPNTLLSYDYLVICSGSSYHRPFKNPNLVISTRAKDLLAASDRVQDAESVVIIGGGTVGVEVAAEIIIQVRFFC
jgi:NADH dehydrogenase FAD-containing subunit